MTGSAPMKNDCLISSSHCARRFQRASANQQKEASATASQSIYTAASVANRRPFSPTHKQIGKNESKRITGNHKGPALEYSRAACYSRCARYQWPISKWLLLFHRNEMPNAEQGPSCWPAQRSVTLDGACGG